LMLDRRESARDKVIHLGAAEIGGPRMTRDCGLHDISEGGANIKFRNVVKFPKQPISLGIAHRSRSFLARIIRWRDNFAGVAFSSDKPCEPPASDLEERLRQSQQKKRQLQRRINALLSQD
jgi:hypothetical protein